MKKNQKNKQTNKLIIITIVVALIIAIIGGATFSYWSWYSNTEEQTNVTVTVPGASLTISGSNVSDVGIYPTSDCKDDDGQILKGSTTVTAVNGTESDMTVKLYLRATLTPNHGTLSEDDKSKLRWYIGEIVVSDSIPAIPVCNNIATQNFSGVTTNTDINTGITFTVPAESTVEKQYEVWVWLDSSYTYTNTGDNVTDPMQDLGINVTWSPASIITQEVQE